MLCKQPPPPPSSEPFQMARRNQKRCLSIALAIKNGSIGEGRCFLHGILRRLQKLVHHLLSGIAIVTGPRICQHGRVLFPLPFPMCCMLQRFSFLSREDHKIYIIKARFLLAKHLLTVQSNSWFYYRSRTENKKK